MKNNLSSSSAAAASGGKVGSGAAAGGTAAYGASGVRSLATGVNEGLIVATVSYFLRVQDELVLTLMW